MQNMKLSYSDFAQLHNALFERIKAQEQEGLRTTIQSDLYRRLTEFLGENPTSREGPLPTFLLAQIPPE